MGTSRLATPARDGVGHHRHRPRRHDSIVQPARRGLLRSPRVRADRARLRRLRRRASSGRARPRDLRSAPGRPHVAGRVRDPPERWCVRHRARRRFPPARRRRSARRCGLDVARSDGSPAGREPAARPVRDCSHAGRGALDRRGQRTAAPNRVRGARLGRGRAVGPRHRTVGPALSGHVALARQQSGCFRGAQRADDVPRGQGAARVASGPGERRRGFRTSLGTPTSPVQGLPPRTACTAGSGSRSGAGATCSA